jgi:uncharacterized protein (DUF1800 family)
MRMLGLGGLSAALSGCDEAADAIATWLEANPHVDLRPPSGDEIDLTQHVLNRLTWGARPGDYRRVEKMGVEAFIEEQLSPENIDEPAMELRLMGFESLAEPTEEMYELDQRQLLADMTRAKLVRAVYSRKQLLEVMVDFWTDHFNIVSEKGDCRWVKAADDRDVIRKHAMGRFRDLLGASALSPAMLVYLDGKDNKVRGPGDKPNENYAREMMELHTLGVHGGYSQRDVQEVARCLSGWTYVNKPVQMRAAEVSFNGAWHDDGEKRVLGQTIAAGGGATDLDRVLDIVAAHPSTAKHLATKLCRRFIADPPPEAAVETVAWAFTKSRGDIRATLRTLFACEAFRSSEHRGTLFKRPMSFVLSALRSTGAKTDCGPAVIEALARMGHAPFAYPTPDGYPMEAEPWLGTLLWRWQFALGLQRGAVHGTSVDAAELTERLGGVEGLARQMLGRAASEAERAALSATEHAMAVLIASPAFQQC